MTEKREPRQRAHAAYWGPSTGPRAAWENCSCKDDFARIEAALLDLQAAEKIETQAHELRLARDRIARLERELRIEKLRECRAAPAPPSVDEMAYILWRAAMPERTGKPKVLPRRMARAVLDLLEQRPADGDGG